MCSWDAMARANRLGKGLVVAAEAGLQLDKVRNLGVLAEQALADKLSQRK